MILVMIILRYGPKLYLHEDVDDECNNHLGVGGLNERSFQPVRDQESDASSRRSNSIDSWQDGLNKQENSSNIRYVLHPKSRDANQ